MAGGGPTEHRAVFDAEVSFTNGGGLQAQGFRLDIAGDDIIADEELGELFVRHLGLLMTGSVVIRNKRIVQEPHRGGRAAAVSGGGGGAARRLSDLSHAPGTNET